MPPPRRLYERYDILSPLMTLYSVPLILLSPFLTRGGGATPVKRAEAPSITGREESSPPTFSTSVWVPVIIVALVLLAVGIIGWSNKKFRSLILPTRATPARTDAQGRRELTAAELTGTINTGAANTDGTPAQPAARTRRTRRPRRTPSQMSVTSLPAYNKEPGEQELVIFRGGDMEDTPLPLAQVNEPDEDDDETSNNSHARNESESSISTEQGLMQTEQDRPTPSRRNSRGDSSHHNLPHSSEESQRLMHTSSESISSVLDDRGEAPPYFEVVEDNATLPQDPPAALALSSSPNCAADINSSQPPPDSGNSLSSPPSSPERRSGIRTFFNRMQHVGAPRALGHARGHSAASTSTLAHGGEPGSSTSPPGSRMGHRATPSTASSFFRTISRQRSQSSINPSARLNSPSLISLNSIGHPLTHTLTRTEITYPKDGPTPEQLKMISSRESIARFGVPYGPDALAFASTSMLDVTQPPPDFDTVMGSAGLASTSSLIMNSSAGASRLSLHVRDNSAGARMPSPLAQASVARQGTVDDTTLSSNAANRAGPSSSSDDATRSAPASAPAAGPSTFTTSPETSESSPISDTVTSKGTVTTMYKSLAPSMASRFNDDDISEFGLRVSKPTSPVATQASQASGSPSLHPGSHRASATGTSETGRSESRASVYSTQSFETANESVRTRAGLRAGAGSRMGGSGSGSEDGGEVDEFGTSKAVTPVGTMSSKHAKEATDATVVNGSVASK